MPKFNVRVNFMPALFEGIEAETWEEAERIAVERAMEIETIIDTKATETYAVDENGYPL